MLQRVPVNDTLAAAIHIKSAFVGNRAFHPRINWQNFIMTEYRPTVERKPPLEFFSTILTDELIPPPKAQLCLQ
jgi:hypothetical protein